MFVRLFRQCERLDAWEDLVSHLHWPDIQLSQWSMPGETPPEDVEITRVVLKGGGCRVNRQQPTTLAYKMIQCPQSSVGNLLLVNVKYDCLVIPVAG